MEDSQNVSVSTAAWLATARLALGFASERPKALGAHRLPTSQALRREEGIYFFEPRLQWATPAFLLLFCMRLAAGRDFPRRESAASTQLDGLHDKLLFVCNGYIDRLDPGKLKPSLREELARLRQGPVILHDGRLPWTQDLQSARPFAVGDLRVRRGLLGRAPCALCECVPQRPFAAPTLPASPSPKLALTSKLRRPSKQGTCRHLNLRRGFPRSVCMYSLLEVFTDEEVLALEKLAPEIRRGFSGTQPSPERKTPNRKRPSILANRRRSRSRRGRCRLRRAKRTARR